MNRQILQLFSLIIVLFALLIAFTSRWTVLEAESLEDNTANRRPLLEEQRIPRGDLLAADGTVLAHSEPTGEGSNRNYTRTYPEDGLFSHAIGYEYVDKGRAGLESSRNDELVGENSEFTSLFEELTGKKQEGDDVYTTLDVDAQRVAIDARQGRTAPWSRSSPPRDASGSWPRFPASTPTTSRSGSPS